MAKSIEKNQLSELDRKCLMKFYLHELKLFRDSSSEYVKSLGLEGGFESVLSIFEEEPLFIKIITDDIDNFIILLDENNNGDFSDFFIMKNGIVETRDVDED